jgi:5-methylcytosine-specific restriction endonuclease McrA
VAAAVKRTCACGAIIGVRQRRCPECESRRLAIRAERSRTYRQYRKTRAAIITGATTCGICGQPLDSTDTIETDHIIPRSHGGSSDAPNLRAVHRRCNLRRGAGQIGTLVSRLIDRIGTL